MARLKKFNLKTRQKGERQRRITWHCEKSASAPPCIFAKAEAHSSDRDRQGETRTRRLRCERDIRFLSTPVHAMTCPIIIPRCNCTRLYSYSRAFLEDEPKKDVRHYSQLRLH
jgi:hypothetical protein